LQYSILFSDMFCLMAAKSRDLLSISEVGVKKVVSVNVNINYKLDPIKRLLSQL
jgi:hypothetical protein